MSITICLYIMMSPSLLPYTMKFRSHVCTLGVNRGLVHWSPSMTKVLVPAPPPAREPSFLVGILVELLFKALPQRIGMVTGHAFDGHKYH